jgi:hypothetical protein
MRNSLINIFRRHFFRQKLILGCFFYVFIFFSFLRLYGQESHDLQFKKTISAEVFAPLLGQTTFGYEVFLGKMITREVKLGIIGLGSQPSNEKYSFEQYGAFLRYGYKFYRYKSPRYTWLVDNYYRFYKPEIYMGIKQVRLHDDDFSQESVVWFCGFVMSYGRRFMLSDDIFFGWDMGLGYSVTRSENQMKSNLGLPLTTSYFALNEGLIGPVLGGSRKFPIAISAGLHLGFVLK